MPNFIMENQNISMGAKMLYGVLCDYARDKTFCYPSKTTLAEKLNVSINSIRNWVRELIKHGFIKTLFQCGKDTFYLFCPKQKSVNIATKKNFYQGGTNFEQGGANFEPKTNVKETTINTPLPPKEKQENQSSKKVWDFKSSNCVFEKFWNIYPKKEKKEESRSLWHRLSRQGKIPPFERLIRALNYFSENSSWHRENGRFIPHAVNFLKGLRWCDVPDEVFKTNQKVVVQSTPIFEVLLF